MPGPSDLRRFQPGQPLQRYPQSEHLNAVLEAMRAIEMRSSDGYSGVKSAIGRLHAAAPELLDRDIIVYKNESIDPVGSIDVPVEYRKFDLVPIGPPYLDPFDADDGEKISSGYITYTSAHADQVPKNAIIMYGIALHDTPSCTLGLAIVSGVSPAFTTDATGTALASLNLFRESTAYDTDAGIGVETHASYFDMRIRQKQHKSEFYGSPTNDIDTDCSGRCHYTCMERPSNPGNLDWFPGTGGCSPNCHCENLGPCSTAGATTSAPCVAVETAQYLERQHARTRNIGVAHMEGSQISQFSFDNMAVCTNKYTGSWEWIPIGENCTKYSECIFVDTNLPTCSESLCGKYRTASCQCSSTTTTTVPPTTTTSTTSSTTTTTCPVSATSGDCGCAEYECVTIGTGTTAWLMKQQFETQKAGCCCPNSIDGPCSVGDTQRVSCDDPALIGCTNGHQDYYVLDGCRTSPYAPPNTSNPWPRRPVGWALGPECCASGCGEQYNQFPEGVRSKSGPWYNPVGCGVLGGIPPNLRSAGIRNYGFGLDEKLYKDPHIRACDLPCPTGSYVTYGVFNESANTAHIRGGFCAYAWKSGAWALIPGVYRNNSNGYSLGDACSALDKFGGTIPGSHCRPPATPNFPPPEGTINYGVCCALSFTTTTTVPPTTSTTSSSSTTPLPP